ncbi:MAG: RNA methyltransferase [Cyanophyceae cyanobacterium]
MLSELARIRIVLVEPAGPLNVGSVARAMKNMGLTQLVLVNPHCDPVGEEARRMAVHGQEILATATQVATLSEGLAGCQRAIATTARPRASTSLESPRTALPWLLTTAGESALIFGPEDRGLSNQELNYGQRFIAIPANPEYPSLNLAQAVAICAYELYQASRQLTDEPENDTEQSASLEILEGYYQHLESVLLKMEYLYPHTATARMEKLRRIYNRAHLSREEVALLRGIVRQTSWALQFLPQNNE